MSGYAIAAILALLGAGVCLLVWLAPDWMAFRQGLADRLRRVVGSERAREDLAQAGLSWVSVRSWLGFRISAALLVGVAGLALFRVLVLGLLGVLVTYHLLGLGLEAVRRRALAARQRALLESIRYGAAVMSRGGSATDMLKALSKTGPYQAREVFVRLVDPGPGLEHSSVAAVQALREELADPLFDDLALALELHWRRGAKLVPALEALSQDWEQTLRLERDAKALRAGVEASVLLLTLLPLGFLLLLEWMSPSLLAPFRKPAGQILLGLSVAWMVLGYQVLQRMSRPPRQERLRLRGAQA